MVATAAVATGVTIWAMQPGSDPTPESKAASVSGNASEANALSQTALQQQVSHDFPGATRTYRRALKLDPQNKDAWYGLGLIAAQTGKTDDAVEAYDKALKIDPSFISALFSEAMLLKSSEPDRAIGLMKRAVRAQPKATTVRLQLGLLLAGKDRDNEAQDEFRRAVADSPSLLSQVPERFRDSVSPSPTASHGGDAT